MKPAISVHGLGKRYRIVHQTAKSYRTLRDELVGVAKRLVGRGEARQTGEEFWALRDIDFEVQPGEIVGVIGRNGAGKSTLLKILSRISPPTVGEIVMRGRVGSLLEVGTGFHPELTGRENIYLSGAILGMKRREVAAKFDEIVAFAEVEKFIDTPVKRYSSGMYVRLAFAVAAHLETEILLVDEVLAVGDASFQKKCMGRMKEVGASGRTVLFVSHNMSAVAALCTKGIFLVNGCVAHNGPIEETLSRYSQTATHEVLSWTGDEGDQDLRLKKTWVRSLRPSGEITTSSPIEIGIEAEVKTEVDGLVLGFTLFSCYDTELAFVLFDDALPPPAPRVQPGLMIQKFVIPANTLAEGNYAIGVDLGKHNVKAVVKNTHGTLKFEVTNSDGLGRRFIVPSVRGFTSLFRPLWNSHDATTHLLK